MLKAYKYRLYPNIEQSKLLDKHFGCCRFIYNLALETKLMSYSGAKINLSAYDLMKQLTQLKKDLPWLSEVCSQALQQSIHDLDKSFINFFKGRSAYPNFKSKQGKQSFRSSHSANIKIKENRVSIPKFRSGIKMVYNRSVIGQIKFATISKTPTGKYFISFCCETGIEIKKPQPISQQTTVGIDLGLKHYIVTSSGAEIDNPKHLHNSIQRLKALQRRASRKKKGSANRKKSNHRVAILYERVSNQRKDFLHKLSTQLIRENQTICCEDLNVRGMVKNHSLAGSISDAGWGMFVEMLKYKAEWYGINFLQVPTFEASTKICNICSDRNETLTLKDREWLCTSCGTLHHRDINAAINIKNYCIIKSGQALPVEPVELPAMVGAVKQENNTKLF